MKKCIRYILGVAYVIGILLIAVKLNKQIVKQQSIISVLQDEQEQLQEDYAEIVEQYIEYGHANEKLCGQLMVFMDQNKELEEELACWKKSGTDDNGIFFGHWMIDILYMNNDLEKQAYCKEITFQNDYIYISGSYLVNEPTYKVAMRLNIFDLWDDVEGIGVTWEELVETFNARYYSGGKSLYNQDYYVEMYIENNEDWNRDIDETEVDFILDAKYYLLDTKTMLCFTRHDGGKVYVLTKDN